MIVHLAIFTALVKGGVLATEYNEHADSEFGRVITPITRKRKVYQRNTYKGETYEQVDTPFVHGSSSLDSIFFRDLAGLRSFSYEQSLSFSFSFSYGFDSNLSYIDLPGYQPKSSPRVDARVDDRRFGDLSGFFILPPPPESKTDSRAGTTRGSSTIIVKYDDGGQTFEEGMILPTIVPVGSDQNMVIENSPQLGTSPQDGVGPLCLICNNDGKVSSKRISISGGPPLSNTEFEISYTYSAAFDTEEIDFVYALETEIFYTIASSLLDCNGGDGRRLRQYNQQPVQRTLAQIHALGDVVSTRTINVLGQCKEKENANLYCFSVETRTSFLFMQVEEDRSAIADAAIDSLRAVQEAMNDSTYVNAIPPLMKVILLRTDPEITGPTSTLDDTISVPPKTQPITESQEKQQQKSKNTAAVIVTGASTFIAVGVFLMALFAARRRWNRQDRDSDLMHMEIDRVPSSITSESYGSQIEQHETRHSHIHPINYSERSGESSDIDWSFFSLARSDTTSTGSSKSFV